MGQIFTQPSFDPGRDIPNLHGKVAVVTGADTGIGFETADQLAAHGAKVYLMCITFNKSIDAIDRITKNKTYLRDTGLLVPLEMDLSSLSSVKAAADIITAKENRLDILINNAGRLASDYRLNQAGIEMSVAVNHVGPFVFTSMLSPLLKSTAAVPGSDVRVVSLASTAYQYVSSVDFTTPEALNGTYAAKGCENEWSAKFCRYGATKLMTILFITELQKRFNDDGVPITCVSVHPGEVATSGCKEHIPMYYLPYVWAACLTPLQGAYTTLFAATSPQVYAYKDRFKGRYLEPFGKIGKLTTSSATDPQLARQLWDATALLVKGDD